jgi:hypothetical protein
MPLQRIRISHPSVARRLTERAGDQIKNALHHHHHLHRAVEEGHTVAHVGHDFIAHHHHPVMEALSGAMAHPTATLGETMHSAMHLLSAMPWM